MRFILLSLVFVIAAAFPATDVTLTVGMLNKMIKKIMLHKEKIPELMRRQIENATQAEKEQFVGFINKLHKGKIKTKVSSAEELVKLIEKEAPLVGKKARVLHEDYKKRYANLTKEAQKFLSKWEGIWFKNLQKLRTSRKAFFDAMIKLLPQYLSELQKFDDKTWKSLEQQFPVQMKFWKENKAKLEQIKKKLGNMTLEDKSKLEKFMEKMKTMRSRRLSKDKEALEKFMNMGFDKFLPPAALE